MKPFREAFGYAEDLQAAYDHYKSYGASSGRRFLTAYRRSEKLLTLHPYVAHTRGHG